MEYDPALYDAAINEVAIAIQEDNPLWGTASVWTLATKVIGRLVEEDLIIKPEQCQWQNPEHTAECDNLAPLTKSWCFDHGIY